MTDRPLTTTELHATFEAIDNAALAREEQRQRAINRTRAIDELETELTGGCGRCDTTADEMCVACDSCRCDRHDDCTRPA